MLGSTQGIAMCTRMMHHSMGRFAPRHRLSIGHVEIPLQFRLIKGLTLLQADLVGVTPRRTAAQVSVARVTPRGPRSWHRRACKERGAARALFQVASARLLSARTYSTLDGEAGLSTRDGSSSPRQMDGQG